jgi:hypothetical protein
MHLLSYSYTKTRYVQSWPSMLRLFGPYQWKNSLMPVRPKSRGACTNHLQPCSTHLTCVFRMNCFLLLTGKKVGWMAQFQFWAGQDFTPQCRDRLWGQPSLLPNGYRGQFSWG